jgi:cobalt/nickel transport system permease protein
MHMADALLSPAVGVTLWAASGATLVWCSRQIRRGADDALIPLMGVLGAFVFAAQMINFTIPGTGSSGHIGGGLLLAILLGRHAAFVVIASVLTVQALFFADGGLLALGANIFNLGFFPCFIGFPLIYRPLLNGNQAPSQHRIGAVTVLTTVISLQLGALGVVAETQLSGISDLPLSSFLLLMQPIHLAIGLVEGLATAALVLFVRCARPDLFAVSFQASPNASPSLQTPTRLIAVFGLIAILTGGVFSWFASSQPDGLEWSIAKATGHPDLPESKSDLHTTLAKLQSQVAVLPDYKFASSSKESPDLASTTGEKKASAPEAWPAVDSGTSFSGIIGGTATLALVMAMSYLIRGRRRAGAPGDAFNR